MWLVIKKRPFISHIFVIHKHSNSLATSLPILIYFTSVVIFFYRDLDPFLVWHNFREQSFFTYLCHQPLSTSQPFVAHQAMATNIRVYTRRTYRRHILAVYIHPSRTGSLFAYLGYSWKRCKGKSSEDARMTFCYRELYRPVVATQGHLVRHAATW